ncbi:MAG: MFS transporter [Culicoidibacterales bacterium]
MKRFKCHIGMLAFVYALTNVFIQPYTAFLGLNATEFSLFQTLNIFALASSQFVFGYLCDKFQTIRTFLRMMMVFVIGLALLVFVSQMYFHLPTFFILCLLLLLQFFQGPLLTLTENWIILSPKRLALFFGNIRMFASLTWGIACFVFGIFLVGSRIQYLPLLVAIFYLFPFFIQSRLNDISNQRTSAYHADVDLKLSQDEKKRLLLFCLFAITALLFFLSGRYFTFIGFLFTDLGIPQSSIPMYIGGTVALMALSEIPLFHYGKVVLERFGAAKLFFLAIVVSLLRVAVMGCFHNAIVYVICGMFQGLIYPSYLLSLRHISKSLVSEKIFNTVFGVFTLVLTLGDMVFTLLLGTYVNQHRMDIVYLVCVASAILSILFFILFNFRKNVYMKQIK